MKKLFMLTLLGSLLMSGYVYAMEEEEKPSRRPEAAAAADPDLGESWIFVDKPAEQPVAPVEFLSEQELQEENKSYGVGLGTIISAYRNVFPAIEKFIKNDLGERLQDLYQQLKTELTERDPLIIDFEKNQRTIDAAENPADVVGQIQLELRALVNSNPRYHLKHVALFWAIHLARSNKSYELELEKKELHNNAILEQLKQNALIFKQKAQEVIAQIQPPYQEEYRSKLYGSAKVANRAIGAISVEEQNNLLNVRIPKISNVQNQLFGNFLKKFGAALKEDNLPEIKDPVRIGFAFSGGGYRAMMLTTGYMAALENLGVLDSCLYTSTLSGSAWFMAPWLFTGMPLKAYKEKLRDLTTSPRPEADVRKRLLELAELPLPPDFLYDAVLPKFVFDIPFSSVDLFGAFLADALLGQIDPPNRHALSLHMQWQMVKDGSVPFPIYTSVSENVIKNWYNWYEFNPLEVENVNLGFSIPSWAFGRKFSAGVSIPPPFPQEVSLGYLMGVFGSAYTVDILHDIDKRHLKGYEAWIQTITRYLAGLREATQETGRLYPAFVNNPWKDLPDHYLRDKAENTADLKQHFTREEKFAFVDAGINFNLPLLPLLKGQRELDVIIVGDATKEGWAAIDGELYPKEIAKFVEYIQAWGITYKRAKNIWGIDIYIPRVTDLKTAHTFVTRSRGGFPSPIFPPIIVYFGFTKQPGFSFDPAKHKFWNTFNFDYTPEQFNALSDLAQYTIERRQDVLIATLWYAYKMRLWRKKLSLGLENPGPMPNLEETLKRVPQPQLISEAEKIGEDKVQKFKETDNIFALFDRMWDYGELYQRMDNYIQHHFATKTAEQRFPEITNINDIVVSGEWLRVEGRSTTMFDICRYVLNLKGTREDQWKNEAIILKAYLDQQNRIVGSRDRLERQPGVKTNETIGRALAIIEKAKDMLMQEAKK